MKLSIIFLAAGADALSMRTAWSAPRMTTAPKETAADGFNRRQALGVAASTVVSSFLTRSEPASAIGPVSMELSNIQYEADTCPPELKAGRIGGSFGGTVSKEVTQQCVKCTATLTNPTKNTLKDIAVFGFVLDEQAGASVIANNPDLRSDAGQFAQIATVPPGENEVSFYFVATIGKDNAGNLPKLTFRSLKGISYPGGARFEALSPCELDSLSDECDEQDEEDIAALRAKKMRY